MLDKADSGVEHGTYLNLGRQAWFCYFARLLPLSKPDQDDR